MAPLTELYIAVSFGFAAAYLLLHVAARPTPSRAMIRGCAFLALSLASLIEGAHLIALALGLCALEGLATALWPRHLARAGAAALGWRGAYLLAFLAAGGGLALNAETLAVQAGVVAGAAGLVWRLWPKLGGVRQWGMALAAATIACAATAIGLPDPLRAAAAGALLLLAADAVTAWALFEARRDAPSLAAAPALAWASAFLGHLMIAAPYFAPPL